jgi:ribonuclease BN (tRNA processing enzyme)
VFLFISHFHFDHIVGLHTLTKFRFKGGLTVCGPQGSREILSLIINHPFTVPLHDLPYPARLIELPAGRELMPFSVEALPLRHASLTLGFRIFIDGKFVSYCPDTGYCENAVVLSKESDLVIAECAYKSGQSNEDWPHLNPETAARIAKEAGAKRLALVHFDAVTHPSMSDRKDSETVAAGIFHNTIATMDDMRILI